MGRIYPPLAANVSLGHGFLIGFRELAYEYLTSLDVLGEMKRKPP